MAGKERGMSKKAKFVVFEGVGAAVRDPDVILRVDGHARDRAEHPRIVVKRLRPQGNHAIVRYRRRAATLSALAAGSGR